MRTRAAGLLTAAMVVGGLLASSAGPAAAQLASTPFTAYGNGEVIATNALTSGSTTLAGVREAASGGSVNSGAGGLTAVTNEFGQNVGPADATKNAYGRGTAVEAGVATGTPQPVDINQIKISGLAEALAPPPSPLVTKAIVIPVNPVLYASTGGGEAKATFDPVYCPVGRPLTYGRGFLENAQLLGSGNAPDGSLQTPLLGTSTSVGNPRAATTSRTVTYMAANGDGTFGVVSETRQTLAPIALNIGAGQLLIEIAGEYGLRTVATGKSTGNSVTTLGNPLITISFQPLVGPPVPVQPTLSLSQIIGAGGITLPAVLQPIIGLSLGAQPRALKGAPGSTPAIAPDGTATSAATDLLRLSLLGGTALDLGLFHMEGAVTAPAGGVKCTVPVSKVASVDPVTVGNDFTYTIKIPSDPALFNTLFNCDLVSISAVDTVTTESGSPRIQLISADHGGVISGNTVTWANLGTYSLNQPPITLTISARIPTSSGAGVLRDTVNVSAMLGSCQGGATGEDIIQGNDTIKGIANLNGSAITGNVTLVGPNVSRGDLAATGGNSWPLVAGGGFLLAALGIVRLRRRVNEVPVKS